MKCGEELSSLLFSLYTSYGGLKKKTSAVVLSERKGEKVGSAVVLDTYEVHTWQHALQHDTSQHVHFRPARVLFFGDKPAEPKNKIGLFEVSLLFIFVVKIPCGGNGLLSEEKRKKEKNERKTKEVKKWDSLTSYVFLMVQ